MFSERRILEKLAAFRDKYGWMPVEHSVEEVERVNRYFKTLYKPGRNGDLFFDDTQWTPQLVKWVQNERAMCILSCAYFLTRYYFISSNDSLLRFAFRAGQLAFYRVLQELEDLNQSIEIQCLKARQQGISTLVEGIMVWFALFSTGAKCSVGSADDQKTQVMMGMLYTALDNIPWWLTPTQTKDKRSGRGLLEFAHVGNSVVIQHGAMHGGIGQGTTPTKIHLSEVCDFTDPVAQIEEGLFKAVHSSPEIFMVLESTGSGNTGWWADQWRNNKEFYWQGRARLLPLFLPWFMTPELYPTPHWLAKFPIPPSWEPAPETLAMRDRCHAYVRYTGMLQRILGRRWLLPDAQAWFWEFNYQEAKRRRTEKSWLRQMPCDDAEALVGENDSVFDTDTIEVVDAGRARNIEVFGILGEGIAEKHDPLPTDVDSSRSYIPVAWQTPREIKLEWGLMPLLGNPEAPAFDPLKKLLVYERPEPGALYAVGVDPGTGVGGDRTVITVTRTGYDAAADIQVAEFASDDISNVEVFAWAAALAAWYSGNDPEHQPRFVIEQRRKFGDSCYHALKLHGFRNHHVFRQYDKHTLRPKPSKNQSEGWFTNAWSRPLLLNMFKFAVENGWYIVNSRWLLDEIKNFEQSIAANGRTRMDHQSGQHDDRIFAAAMSYFTLHDLDVMAERCKIRYTKDAEVSYTVSLEPWEGYTMTDTAAVAFFEAAND